MAFVLIYCLRIDLNLDIDGSNSGRLQETTTALRNWKIIDIKPWLTVY